MPPRSPKAPSVFTLKISIKNTKPPIWRRVTMPGGSTFEQLHQTIQTIFDWDDAHLHEFEVRSLRLGHPEHWEEEANDIGDEASVTLDSVLRKPKEKLLYTYDFGDDWEHQILVEKIERLPAGSPQSPIRCIDGRRRAPMEDCGGPWGWADLIQAVNHRNHPRHRDLIEWAGGRIDPEEFDLEGINEALSKA